MLLHQKKKCLHRETLIDVLTSIKECKPFNNYTHVIIKWALSHVLYICQDKFRTASHLGIAEGELSKLFLLYDISLTMSLLHIRLQ